MGNNTIAAPISGFNYQKFSEDIREYAKSEKKTYLDLSKTFGVSLGTAQRIMNQKTDNPKIDTVYACCRALRLDPDRYRTGWPKIEIKPDPKPSGDGFDRITFMRDISEQRAVRKISQKRIAEELGISRQAYNKLENTETGDISVEQIYRLASIMEIRSLDRYMPGVKGGKTN